MKNVVAVMMCAFLLSACAQQKDIYVWNDIHDGNSLTTSSGVVDRAGQDYRYVRVVNTGRTWAGRFAGGEEKVEERKNFMSHLAKEEMKRTCEEKPLENVSEPYFVMLEKAPEAYGGGLLGYAIASAAASYENLPTQMSQSFNCSGDEAAIPALFGEE